MKLGQILIEIKKKDKLQNIKDYFTTCKNSELHELRTALELEIYLSEMCITQGEEKRK